VHRSGEPNFCGGNEPVRPLTSRGPRPAFIRPDRLSQGRTTPRSPLQGWRITVLSRRRNRSHWVFSMRPHTSAVGCPNCSAGSRAPTSPAPCLIRRPVRRKPGLLRPHVWCCAACYASSPTSRTVRCCYVRWFRIGYCRCACKMCLLREPGSTSRSKQTAASMCATCSRGYGW
jgi:hypothetical protein